MVPYHISNGSLSYIGWFPIIYRMVPYHISDGSLECCIKHIYEIDISTLIRRRIGLRYEVEYGSSSNRLRVNSSESSLNNSSHSSGGDDVYFNEASTSILSPLKNNNTYTTNTNNNNNNINATPTTPNPTTPISTTPNPTTPTTTNTLATEAAELLRTSFGDIMSKLLVQVGVV